MVLKLVFRRVKITLAVSPGGACNGTLPGLILCAGFGIFMSKILDLNVKVFPYGL